MKNVLVSWRFPVLALSLLAAITVMTFAVLLIPSGESHIGQFAESFKIWCFGYDPATGRFDYNYVAVMLTQPLLIAVLILWAWWKPLRHSRGRRRRDVALWSGSAILIAALSVGTLFTLDAEADQGELPFPAEEIRTSHTPPEFTLTNQAGEAVSLEQFRGKVVLVTAVYASCGLTCPTIMAQTKRAVATLTSEQLSELRVLAITLDPERDDRVRLAELAEAQGIGPPVYHLLTGDAQAVNETLDAFQIYRKKDPETGVIDHANLFYLIDKKGLIAYRLSLGKRQERWLTTGLGVLVDER